MSDFILFQGTPSDILDFLIEIVGALLEREYVKVGYFIVSLKAHKNKSKLYELLTIPFSVGK